MRNAICSELHVFNTSRQLGYGTRCALWHTARFCYVSNIIEYVQEACWLEVHQLWRAWQSLGKSCNRAITDSADVAQFLSENYVRTQPSQKLLIDRVNRPVITQRATNPLIDFATRQARIMDRTTSDSWPRVCFFGEIAFMRNTYYLVHQPKRGRDLGRSGQKRNDAGHF